MRLVPLLALCLALPALAQTPPPEAFYPLAIGDVREYRGTGPASTPYPRYTSRESVVGDTLAGGLHYRLVERLYLEDGQPLVRSRHAVRFDTAAARPVERLPDGTEAPRALCRLDLAAPCANDLGVEPVQIGSDVTERAVRSAFNLVASERYAAGIGLVARETDDGADYVERLTFARLGGLRYGTPSTALPPTPPTASDFWPLQVGNGWAYELTEYGAGGFTLREAMEVVGDTLLGGYRYATRRYCSSFRSITGPFSPWNCSLGFVRIDDGAGEILGWAGEGQPESVEMCGLNPSPDHIVTCVPDGQVIIINPGPNNLMVGTQLVPVGQIRTMDTLASPGPPGWAEGFGRLEHRPWWGTSSITYARIGTQAYGVFPVEAEAFPQAGALALAVSPNPTAGAAVLTLSLPAPARVVVKAFDALGRRVLSTDADASAGETRLAVDAHGWAPGLYLVRATTDGGAAATTRFVRR